MDNAITRRGKKSLHIAFGESAAILTGDLLQNKAYHIISEYYSNNKKLIDFFFETTADKGIIKGQVLDISYKLKNPPLNTLITIYKLKTGALFSLAASGPAFIKQLSEKEINKFKKIGEFIGITYQIKDDIQDRNIQLEPNIVRCIGLEKAQKFLNTYIAKLFKSVKQYPYLQKFIYKVFENAQNN
jgi:geranylgeranyl diphosphate synthase, type II